MNKKADAFKNFLKEKNITCFKADDVPKDDLNSVVFRSQIEVEGQNLPTIVIIDDSIYCMLRVLIANKALRDSNETKLLHEINELNKRYKVFKYYFGDDGGLYLDCCILCEDGKVSGDLIYTILDVIIKHLNEEYKNIMKIIWQ
ncbi:MAG: hypothetical protein EOL98_05435 [Negativicutes bacterium]|nr:hypothetical protein [Negativicutes bacterium]